MRERATLVALINTDRDDRDWLRQDLKFIALKIMVTNTRKFYIEMFKAFPSMVSTEDRVSI